MEQNKNHSMTLDYDSDAETDTASDRVGCVDRVIGNVGSSPK